MPPPPQRPTAPASVLTAVKLMYTGAAFSLIGIVISLTAKDAIHKAIIASRPSLTDSEINTAVNVGIAFGVIVGLIGVGLWLWMAFANKAGHSWARIVSTVLFGINTLGLLYIVISPNSGFQKLGSAVGWLIGLGAIMFLWRSDSSAYFNAA